MRFPLRIIGLHMPAVLAFLTLGAGFLWAQPPNPAITWSVPPPAVTLAAGGTLRGEVSAKIDDGRSPHFLTQPSPRDPTRVAVAAGQPVAFGGKIEAPVPESGLDEAQGTDTEYYAEPVTFRRPLSVVRTTATCEHAARIKETWKACSGSICLGPQTATLEVPFQVTTAK